MTLAAVDLLVHHATIFEMNGGSCRRRSAMEAKRKRGKPALCEIRKYPTLSLIRTYLLAAFWRLVESQRVTHLTHTRLTSRCE